MQHNTRLPFRRQYKLPLQGAAFCTMILVPIALYFAARVGHGAIVLALLVAQGGGMLLAAWVG